MTKPWEETWTAADGNVNRGAVRLFRVRTRAPDENAPARVHVAYDDAVAQLVSAAPDMARALIAIEWAGLDREGDLCCPSCNGYDDERQHHPGCSLDASLRKAGLR